MKIYLFILLSLILIIWVGDIYPQSSNNERDVFRLFDQNKIDQYKENNNYYLLEGSPSSNWNRFIQWLSTKLERFSKNVPNEKLASVISLVIKILLWSLGIFAVAMVFITLFKGKINVVQKADKNIELDYQNLEEQINTNWQDLIDIEITASRFNVALRLLFLQTIQLLNEKQLINWEKDKTNFDYLRELRKTKFGNTFSNLMKFYNFGWFGGFEVNEQEFWEIHKEFNAFNTSLI